MVAEDTIYDRARRRVLRRVLRADAEVGRLYAETARRLRERLRGLRVHSEAEIARALEEELLRTEEALLPIVERSLELAAASGNEAARRTLDRLGALRGASPLDFPSGSRSRPRLCLVPRRESGGQSDETG